MQTAPAQGGVITELEENGIVVLPELIGGEDLRDMQRAFQTVLRGLRWNDYDGYEKTEKHRHMVQNVLTLAQGFVDLPLHSLVKDTLRAYIGPTYELVEAKGWKSLPTREDFHGWHGDAWYDQTRVQGIPHEVKLALYLTDVRSGAFNYIRGSHSKSAPRPVKNNEVADVPASRIVEVLGRAGTVCLFDTSGVHRQSIPILEERHAVFYNFHDPDIPLQAEDVEYYRYHPLLLNAAFLGDLSDEDRRILGFGNKTNYVPSFERKQRHPRFQRALQTAYDTKLVFDEVGGRVLNRLKRTVKLKTN